MPRTRPAYPDEFRQEAVAMVRGGRSVRDVAESLGVSQQSLRKWVKQTELDGRERDDGLRSEEREELPSLDVLKETHPQRMAAAFRRARDIP
jgi:transposase